jgi:hypothetical protein
LTAPGAPGAGVWAQQRPLDPVAEQAADEALDADVGAAGFSPGVGHPADRPTRSLPRADAMGKGIDQ